MKGAMEESQDVGRPEGILARGISFAILWFDDEVIELSVRASNGRFAGTARLYAGREGLAEVASAFRGFPSSNADSRELVLGTFDPACAGGGVRLRLGCTDAAGHAAVEAELRTDPQASEVGQSERAQLVVVVEPGAIDDFVAAVDRMPVEVGAVAHLRQAT